MRPLGLILFFLQVPMLWGAELNWLDAAKQEGILAFHSESILHNAKSNTKAWGNTCLSLAKKLSIKPGQSGFLKKISCEFGKRFDTLEKDKPWVILISEKQKFVDIDIYYRSDQDTTSVQSLSYSFEGNFLENLKEKNVQIFLSRLIIESLPMGWSVDYPGEGKSISFEIDQKLPTPPLSLILYELAYDKTNKLWLPKAIAQLDHIEQNKVNKNRRSEVYRIDKQWLPLKPGKRYWVHSPSGRNFQQADHEKNLMSQLKGFSFLNFADRLLFQSFSSNFAGLRYGKMMLNGQSIAAHSSLISILVEMRSGPLDGLRWYYDTIPRVEQARDQGPDHFSMSRASFGWAIDYAAPSLFKTYITRIDVQPKIGLMDLDYLSHIGEDSTEAETLSFEVKNNLNLGLEIGLERENNYTRQRLWSAFSNAKFGLQNKDGISINNLRLGYDLNIETGKWGKIESNLLFF
ncbi:MAG: hypothetical protein NTX25_18910 [Proteobacteria bacterium]|nr:hypothetical protein [Pseudomonadota bacterium]